MKKIVLLACCMYAFASYSQTILSAKIPPAPAAKASADTQNLAAASPHGINKLCPKLANITISFLLDEDDATLGVIRDSTGEALQSYIMVQPNKELFYDKLKKALASLCEDKDAVDTIVARYKGTDPDLYTEYLEKMQDLINIDGKAGVLYIQKKVFVNGTGKATDTSVEAMKGIDRRLKGLTTKTEANSLQQVSFARMEMSGAGPYMEYTVTDPIDTTPAGDVSFKPMPNFTLQSIQIQFQDGFIENIKIFGKLKGYAELLRFENEYPIAFSTKKDFRNLVDVILYEKSDYRRHWDFQLHLGNVISYNQNLANDNKDYSPANQVLTIKAISDSVKEVTLYKEQTSRILEMQVFSDLRGADNNNPNGLIQLELNKRINLLSRRRKMFHIGNWGVFNYFTPRFSIDKIEDNQKRLVLSRIDTLTLTSDTSKAITYTSTINLLRHQIYSVGLDITCLTADLPVIKSTFYLGMGFHFGRSALQDTFRTRVASAPGKILFQAAPTNNVLEYGVNTFRYGPYLTWQAFPDSRFGFIATQRLTWFYAYSSNFVQVRDSAHYLKFIAQTAPSKIRDTYYQFHRCIGATEIFAYFKSNSNGSNKLFFRYRFNYDLANLKENFHQMQVGFSTYLTATKEYNKLKKASKIE